MVLAYSMNYGNSTHQVWSRLTFGVWKYSGIPLLLKQWMRLKKQFVIHNSEVTTFLSLCLIHLNFRLKMLYWTVFLIIVNKYFICGHEFIFTIQYLPCSWKHVAFVLECNFFFQSYTCKYNFDVSPNKMFLINL